VPSRVIGDACSVENGRSVADELHNCLLDIEEALQRCKMSSGKLLTVFISLKGRAAPAVSQFLHAIPRPVREIRQPHNVREPPLRTACV